MTQISILSGGSLQAVDDKTAAAHETEWKTWYKKNFAQ